MLNLLARFRKLLIPIGLLLLLTVALLEFQRRRLLWDEFAAAHERNTIPWKSAAFARVGDLDVAFQAPSTAGPGHDLRHDYVVGLGFRWRQLRYQHLISLFGVDPRAEPALVRAAATYYQSDSTYLGVMRRQDGNTQALVYRQTNPAKVGDLPRPEAFRYMMWRWERIRFDNGRIEAVVEEEMNSHLF